MVRTMYFADWVAVDRSPATYSLMGTIHNRRPGVTVAGIPNGPKHSCELAIFHMLWRAEWDDLVRSDNLDKRDSL